MAFDWLIEIVRTRATGTTYSSHGGALVIDPRALVITMS